MSFLSRFFSKRKKKKDVVTKQSVDNLESFVEEAFQSAQSKKSK